MVKIVVISEYCDPCYRQDGLSKDAVFSELISLGKVTKNLALCEDHVGTVFTLSQLVAFLETNGTKPGEEARPPSKQAQRKLETLPVTVPPKLVSEFKLSCPYPGCKYSCKVRGTLREHVRTTHSTTLSELEGKPRKPGIECTELTEDGSQCDFVAAAPQGMGAHRRSRHNIVGMAPSSIIARHKVS